MATTLNIDFFKHSRADNSAVRGRIWSKFDLIREVTNVLVNSKNKEDPNKKEGARVATTLNEPRREKTGLRGFRPGPTQTGLYKLRKELEA